MLFTTGAKSSFSSSGCDLDDVEEVRNGNGYKISTYLCMPNPMGADTGLNLCQRARAQV